MTQNANTQILIRQYHVVFTLTSIMATGYLQTVVWERLNKVNKWCPYPAEVCHLLEQAYQKNLSSVWLGDADVNLKLYTVNLKDFVQISESTGTKRPVRRHICDQESALSKQVMWQWLGDRHSWQCYSAEVANFIEEAYKAEQEMIDLSVHFPGYHYVVDFSKMMQKNKKTRYHRPIRRVDGPLFPIQNALGAPNSNENVQNGFCTDVSPSTDNANALLDAQCEVKLSKKKKKRHGALGKQVNMLWKKIGLSKESDSDSGDPPDGSTVQKPGIAPGKTSHSAVLGDVASAPAHFPVYGFIDPGAPLYDNDEDITQSNVINYALVNGKPWKHSWPPHTPRSEIKPVPGIEALPDTSSRSRRKGAESYVHPPVDVDVLSEFSEQVLPPSESQEEQVCIICYEDLREGSSYDDDHALLKLKLCSHIFHKSCLKAMYESRAKDQHLQCPTCKTIHGVKMGTQPPGKMVYHVLPYSLPGHHDCETIQIIYDIKPGTQGPEHPNPGKRYTARGFPRCCYLPENETGRKVLRLLIKAWERRLIFTVGSSSTTGENDTVVWNEIHHKTEFGFNRHGHGYPDPQYFENVISELAAHGVTEASYAWYPV